MYDVLMEELILHSRFHHLGVGLSEISSPIGISNPIEIAYNTEVAQLMGLPSAECLSEKLLSIFSGNDVVKGSTPVAQSYAGHQFGNFNPFLGDGRSVLLGEVDIENQQWDISLKGSGKTPFTFSSDGRASVSECMSEYEMSEKLNSLAVPVTRCLSVIQADEQVYRSGFEPVAVLAKMTPSNIRFGSFENCYFRKDIDALKRLADYVIENHFQECLGSAEGNQKGGNDYAQFFHQVVIRTAKLIAQWQKVGFVHGMMNTDNQSIVGVTMDLGDSVLLDASLDEFDDEFVASRSDRKGRYAYGQQPQVGLWNCNVLAKALSPIISAKDLKAALMNYETAFIEAFEKG